MDLVVHSSLDFHISSLAALASVVLFFPICNLFASSSRRNPRSEIQMTWSIATVLLGTLATVAIAVIKWVPRRNGTRIYASLVEMTEIRTRLDSLERSHALLRTELRGDIKELERVIRDLLPGA